MNNIQPHYWDNRFKRHAIKLLPGDYYAINGAEVIVTVLGSCVSACIQDYYLKIGGMNHFMLPMEGRYSVDGAHVHIQDDSAAARYGNVAMEWLINEIIKLGGDRHNMQAKIVGGGRVTNGTNDIGADNIDFVREYLQMENIEIISEDVGGILPRKVYYIPETNDLYIKKIQRMNNDTIVTREKNYLNSLQESAMEGQVFYLD